jgi:DNA repair protein RecN (Recombination protein N)
MLRRLEIENYGLIARAGLDFAPGATIFTGETGSGKTMLLGALAFALGARTGADAVRRGAARAFVSLTFEPGEALRERLAADGFALDPGEDAVLERELTEAGRSSVRINGRAATAGYVREIGDAIAEIVGQHEHQRLLAPASHTQMLDLFANAGAARAEVASAYVRRQALAGEVERLGDDERRALRDVEDARAAVAEIDSAAIRIGEDATLNERRATLDNVERIVAALRLASDALAGDEAGATGALGAARAALAGVAAVSGDLRALAESAAALQSEANDLAARIGRALDEAESNPAELEAINARLDALEKLKRKHGGTLERVLEAAESARAIVEKYEQRDQRAAELAAEASEAERALVASAAVLAKLRAASASDLAQRVVAEFGDLALGSARFEVRLEPLDRIGATGSERAAFSFAANAGEALRPLAKVASGGELSRVLLALVVALAGTREAGALIFDEIDAGIGGATGAAVGARIGRLAKTDQVVCVTHLAQLASWADRHYVLDKSEEAGGTTISVREVAGSQRELELARMLSGETHDTALRHARELLKHRRAQAAT